MNAFIENKQKYEWYENSMVSKRIRSRTKYLSGKIEGRHLFFLIFSLRPGRRLSWVMPQMEADDGCMIQVLTKSSAG